VISANSLVSAYVHDAFSAHPLKMARFDKLLSRLTAENSADSLNFLSFRFYFSANSLKIVTDEDAGVRSSFDPASRAAAALHHSAREASRSLDAIPAERQELALRVLDTVIAGYELEDLGRRLGR